ncbi:unnamed protein product [Penicillium nalgiovense]|nr:unnamed protein product [Penicillium nalgiovense]
MQYPRPQAMHSYPNQPACDEPASLNSTLGGNSPHHHHRPTANPTTIKMATSTPENKNRARRTGRKAATVAKPQRDLLFDELGDALVEQLYADPKLNDDLAPDNPHRNLYTVLTAFDAKPPTSLHIPNDRQNGMAFIPATPEDNPPPLGSKFRPIKSKTMQHPNISTLADLSTMATIELLAARYGQVAHMGILDRSYRFFVNKARTAALSFKVLNRVAIVGGDPLCDVAAIPDLVAEFAEYRRWFGWGVAFLGASESFMQGYAAPQGWTTVRFGTERVLNPLTNEVLLERGGKRITVQNRRLLHPRKGGITLGMYTPATHGTNQPLQTDLAAIYDAWCAHRNNSATPQTFITVYDLFALPALMTFIYTRGPDGRPNGFAALRRLGVGRYHLDPCISTPGSPKGISDLLLVTAMAILHRVGASYLGFGFEPLHVLLPGHINGMPRPLAGLTSTLYGHIFHRLSICGKKAYHDKFYPDLIQDSGLYLLFPAGVPGPLDLLAMAHMANISLRKIIWADVRFWNFKRRVKGELTR